jgi:hypothetical protein
LQNSIRNEIIIKLGSCSLSIETLTSPVHVTADTAKNNPSINLIPADALIEHPATRLVRIKIGTKREI